MAVHRLIVFTESKPGRDAEFNTWYDQVHLKDVIEVGGFVAAQRFEVSPTQMDGMAAPPGRYLAIYEIETDDLEGALETLGASAGTMEMSDALADGAQAFVYSAIGERKARA